jgi:hypothetical protein
VSTGTALALTGTLVVVGILVVACTPPSALPSGQAFVPSEGGIIRSTESTPTDTTVVLENGQRLTFGNGIRWLNGLGGNGDLLLAGTLPTRWAATLVEGAPELQPCYEVPGVAWDRGDRLEIALATGDGVVTMRVAKAPGWTSLGTEASGQLTGALTCLDASGRAVSRVRGGS